MFLIHDMYKMYFTGKKTTTFVENSIKIVPFKTNAFKENVHSPVYKIRVGMFTYILYRYYIIR